jgi:hypothetical protein
MLLTICFAQSAKHFLLLLSCEKYIFDYTKSDASTDFVFDESFSQLTYMFCTKHFPSFISCEKYIFDNTKSDASADFVLDKSSSQLTYVQLTY